VRWLAKPTVLHDVAFGDHGPIKVK
jgi:hypothetical protein